ncbi:MAG: SDR family oxidoreductase [Parvularculaceae bacterium]
MNYKGKWALVTGASAGIGAAFARALAAKGANVALTARRPDRLADLASEIEREFGVKTLVVPADLADPAGPSRIADALKAKTVEIDILINNAGYGLPGTFVENQWKDHRAFIDCLVASHVELAHRFLPAMQKKRWGRIVNVASVAGLVPGSAGHTLYGAAKAFIVSFSQSLAAENENNGVHVSALCPGFTYSEFHDANGTRALVSQMPKFMFMNAEPVVESGLAAVERAHVVFVPGAWNKLVAGLMKALPRPWGAALVKSQSKNFRRSNPTS